MPGLAEGIQGRRRTLGNIDVSPLQVVGHAAPTDTQHAGRQPPSTHHSRSFSDEGHVLRSPKPQEVYNAAVAELQESEGKQQQPTQKYKPSAPGPPSPAMQRRNSVPLYVPGVLGPPTSGPASPSILTPTGSGRLHSFKEHSGSSTPRLGDDNGRFGNPASGGAATGGGSNGTTVTESPDYRRRVVSAPDGQHSAMTFVSGSDAWRQHAPGGGGGGSRMLPHMDPPRHSFLHDTSHATEGPDSPASVNTPLSNDSPHGLPYGTSRFAPDGGAGRHTGFRPRPPGESAAPPPHAPHSMVPHAPQTDNRTPRFRRSSGVTYAEHDAHAAMVAALAHGTSAFAGGGSSTIGGSSSDTSSARFLKEAGAPGRSQRRVSIDVLPSEHSKSNGITGLAPDSQAQADTARRLRRRSLVMPSDSKAYMAALANGGGSSSSSTAGTPSSPMPGINLMTRQSSTPLTMAIVPEGDVNGLGSTPSSSGSRPTSGRSKAVQKLVDAVRSKDEQQLLNTLSYLEDPASGAVAGLNDRHPLTGRTALHEAVALNCLGMVQTLLSAGSNPDVGHVQSGPPLLHAAATGETQMAELLLQHRADVNACDVEKHTALHYACAGGHIATARLLIKRGASYKVRTVDDESPLDLARPEVVKALFGDGAAEKSSPTFLSQTLRAGSSSLAAAAGATPPLSPAGGAGRDGEPLAWQRPRRTRTEELIEHPADSPSGSTIKSDNSEDFPPPAPTPPLLQLPTKLTTLLRKGAQLQDILAAFFEDDQDLIRRAGGAGGTLQPVPEGTQLNGKYPAGLESSALPAGLTVSQVAAALATAANATPGVSPTIAGPAALYMSGGGGGGNGGILAGAPAGRPSPFSPPSHANSLFSPPGSSSHTHFYSPLRPSSASSTNGTTEPAYPSLLPSSAPPAAPAALFPQHPQHPTPFAAAFGGSKFKFGLDSNTSTGGGSSDAASTRFSVRSPMSTAQSAPHPFGAPPPLVLQPEEKAQVAQELVQLVQQHQQLQQAQQQQQQQQLLQQGQITSPQQQILSPPQQSKPSWTPPGLLQPAMQLQQRPLTPGGGRRVLPPVVLSPRPPPQPPQPPSSSSPLSQAPTLHQHQQQFHHQQFHQQPSQQQQLSQQQQQQQQSQQQQYVPHPSPAAPRASSPASASNSAATARTATTATASSAPFPVTATAATTEDDKFALPPPLERADSPDSSPRGSPTGNSPRSTEFLSPKRIYKDGVKDPMKVSMAAEALSEALVGAPPEAINARAEAMFNRSVELRTGNIKWARGELLGEGAFGKVYSGLNQETGELMAVKVLELVGRSGSDQANTQLRELQQELELYKTLEHEHIVGFYDAHFESRTNTLFIFLEYVPGGSIASMVERFGKFSEDLVRNYTRQLLLGLEYLHQCKVVHRDLKGGNILVSRDGIIKLADFGASKAYRDATMTDGMKSLRGSVFWMAPEVIKGTGYGRRADVWSLGCTVIEMLTGAHPWPDLDNHWSAMFQIVRNTEGPPRPPGLSDLGKDFLDLVLQYDPAKRPTPTELLHHPWVAEVPKPCSRRQSNYGGPASGLLS